MINLNNSQKDFEELANKIFMITEYLVLEYSGYKRWYFEKNHNKNYYNKSNENDNGLTF